MTACQLCGHPDSRHRMMDYQLTLREFVALTVEVGVEVML